MKLSELIKKLQDAQNIFDGLDMDPDMFIENQNSYSVITKVKSEITHNDDDTVKDAGCSVVLKSK